MYVPVVPMALVAVNVVVLAETRPEPVSVAVTVPDAAPLRIAWPVAVLGLGVRTTSPSPVFVDAVIDTVRVTKPVAVIV